MSIVTGHLCVWRTSVPFSINLVLSWNYCHRFVNVIMVILVECCGICCWAIVRIMSFCVPCPAIPIVAVVVVFIILLVFPLFLLSLFLLPVQVLAAAADDNRMTAAVVSFSSSSIRTVSVVATATRQWLTSPSSPCCYCCCCSSSSSAYTVSTEAAAARWRWWWYVLPVHVSVAERHDSVSVLAVAVYCRLSEEWLLFHNKSQKK